MSEPSKEPEKGEEKEKAKEEKFSGPPVTRKTLIERLDNWSDWSSWDEFYRTYSSFVWHVARKAGLSDHEAHDVVQETFIGVAKNLQKKKFDTSLGSFKSPESGALADFGSIPASEKAAESRGEFVRLRRDG